MHGFAENHKQRCCANSASEPHPQAAYQQAGNSGEMHCIPTKFLRGDSGLSRVDIALLSYILDNPTEQGARAEIADACCCAPYSIPRSAKKLEAMQLIERVIAPGERTRYKAGRNLHVTTGDAEVTSAAHVTPVVTSELRANAGGSESETTTTTRVVTAETGGRNIPPLEPPNNTTSVEEGSKPSNTEDVVDRGPGGELFALADEGKPQRRRQGTKRRPKRVAFGATEETMPQTPTPEAEKYALDKKLRNGTLAEQWAKFRRYHIREGSLIKSLEQRWETWVDNWARDNAPKAGAAPKGYKFAGTGPDGKPIYNRDHSQNFYRT